MKPMPKFLMLDWTSLLFFILFFSSALARMSPEERAKLRSNAEAADKQLRFLEIKDVEKTIKETPALILMFGANWCVNTQRFTPKFLEVQKLVDAHITDTRFKMFKVECTADGEKFCVNEMKIEGYPTLFVYKNGALVEEYPEDDEAEALWKYIQKMVEQLPAKKTESPQVVTKIEQKKLAKDQQEQIDHPISDNDSAAPVKPTKSSWAWYLVPMIGIAGIAFSKIKVNKRSYVHLSDDDHLA
jgi:thioredoxin-like negative regulator of GroEL